MIYIYFITKLDFLHFVFYLRLKVLIGHFESREEECERICVIASRYFIYLIFTEIILLFSSKQKTFTLQTSYHLCFQSHSDSKSI